MRTSFVSSVGMSLGALAALAVAGCPATARPTEPGSRAQGAAPATPPSAPRPAAQTIDDSRATFVQWTDLHLFDAGTGKHGSGVHAEALDNEAAARWAVLHTNRLHADIRGGVDFVVITGDLGLSNVLMPPHAGRSNACPCPTERPAGVGPMPARRLDQVVADFADLLRGLTVHTVFMVPGDADLCQGSAADMHRWTAFITALQAALSADPVKVADLTDHKYRGSSGPPEVAGFRLLGLNTAFLAPGEARALSPQTLATMQRELASVHGSIAAGRSHLLFTHIPDVGPAENSFLSMLLAWPLAFATPTGNATPTAGTPSVPAAIRRRWEADIRGLSEVVGVFGGHSHAAQRDQYPLRLQNPVPGPASPRWKVRWAPPLSASGQSGTPEVARGMLLVSASGDGTVRLPLAGDVGSRKEVPIWFNQGGDPPDPATEATLVKGGYAEAERDWDAATEAYTAALSSPDGSARSAARAGLNRVRPRARSWHWQAGQPFKWAGQYRERAAVIAGALLLFLGVRLWRRRMVVLPAVAMAGTPPAKWFDGELLLARKEIVERLRREAAAHQIDEVGGGFLKAADAAVLEPIISAIPAVQSGVDVQGIAKFLFAVWRHTGWTLDVGLAADNGTLTAIAVRRHAGFTRGSWRADVNQPPAPPNPANFSALPLLARRLAARIAGSQLT